MLLLRHEVDIGWLDVQQISVVVVVVVVAAGGGGGGHIHITLHHIIKCIQSGACVTKSDVGNDSMSRELWSSPHQMPKDEESTKESVSQCPTILMPQIRYEKPCMVARPSSRNKIHRFLKLGREIEIKTMHGSTCQRERTRMLRQY